MHHGFGSPDRQWRKRPAHRRRNRRIWGGTFCRLCYPNIVPTTNIAGVGTLSRDRATQHEVPPAPASHHSLRSACAALECGSLLPLSSPRGCFGDFEIATVPATRRDWRNASASKLAGQKAAASCRTLKLRRAWQYASHAFRVTIFLIINITGYPRCDIFRPPIFINITGYPFIFDIVFFAPSMGPENLLTHLASMTSIF